jgi:phosphoenolpyruvate carboxykinase (GTP)
MSSSSTLADDEQLQVSVAQLKDWASAHSALTKCDNIVFADGSVAEFERVSAMMVASGSLIPLSRRPRSFAARSNPFDVARVEGKTFICAPCGPLNNFMDPTAARHQLSTLFAGSARGRTLYVIAFRMGPPHALGSKLAVQLTDSPYVLLSTHIMCAVAPFETLAKTVSADAVKNWVRLVHSMGMPLEGGEVADVPWPCSPSQVIVAHFPETREVASFGSNYGGNALLGKKCLSLRLGSVLARDEGWFAEHMAILGIENEGIKRYVAFAAPSACGKTAFSTMESTLPSWKVTLVGDDIAWLRFDADGKLRAINPETGLFGVAPGTLATSPAGLACQTDCIFTNVAITENGDDVYYEGLTSTAPQKASSWLRRDWVPDSHTLAAHPNSRFIVRATKMPTLDTNWQDPKGVIIDAIIFASRRDDTVPLIVESVNWEEGVLAAATLASNSTAAQEGMMGKLRADPMAMRPFIGYAVGDYFSHWLKASELQAQAMGNPLHEVPALPKIYRMNVFRKIDGKIVWPGFGDNIRLLKWICRGDSSASSIMTPIGFVPAPGAIDVSGHFTLPAEILNRICAVDNDEWSIEQLRAKNELKMMEAPLKLLEACDTVTKRFGFAKISSADQEKQTTTTTTRRPLPSATE